MFFKKPKCIEPINCNAIMLHPKQAFEDWVNSFENSEYALKINREYGDNYVFLIESCSVLYTLSIDFSCLKISQFSNDHLWKMTDPW